MKKERRVLEVCSDESRFIESRSLLLPSTHDRVDLLPGRYSYAQHGGVGCTQVKNDAGGGLGSGQGGEAAKRGTIIWAWRLGGLDFNGNQVHSGVKEEINFKAVVTAPPKEGVGSLAASAPDLDDLSDHPVFNQGAPGRMRGKNVRIGNPQKPTGQTGVEKV